MRFAYADPPYLGCGSKYAPFHPQAMDWNDINRHAELVLQLTKEFPDGWAMSASSVSLGQIMGIYYMPADVRVAAWVKPFAVFKPNVNPAYAWEPVIFRGGRKRSRKEPTVRDWHSENITMRKGLPGAKPPGFALWIAQLLGADWKQGDEIVDLFPGTGAMSSVWRASA